MYGIKRGIRAPGEFGFMDMTGLALAGSAGIIAAIITDYQQKGEAAALFRINEWVVQAASLLGVAYVPLWMVVLGLTVAGAGSVFYFQPITRQGAFAQGFGLLAVLLTMTPPNLASGIGGMDDLLPGLAFNEPMISKASYNPGDARLTLAQASERKGARYDVRLRINYPNGLPEDMSTMIRNGSMRGRLHNAQTGQTYNLFRTTAGAKFERDGNTLIFDVGVPARAAEAALWIRIETAGYTIEEQSANATLGEPLKWNVNMRPSSIPLGVQRFGKSYWF